MAFSSDVRILPVIHDLFDLSLIVLLQTHILRHSSSKLSNSHSSSFTSKVESCGTDSSVLFGGDVGIDGEKIERFGRRG